MPPLNDTDTTDILDRIKGIVPEKNAKPDGGNTEPDTAQEEKAAAQTKRADASGIAPKEGGSLTRPAEFDDVPDDNESWGDWTNYGYPLVPKARADAAAARHGDADNQSAGGYSDEEWAKIGERIASAQAKDGETPADEGDKSLETTDDTKSAPQGDVADPQNPDEGQVQKDAVTVAAHMPSVAEEMADQVLQDKLYDLWWAFCSAWGEVDEQGDESGEEPNLATYDALIDEFAGLLKAAFAASGQAKSLLSLATIKRIARISKAGARHSKSDMADIQAIHDKAMGLGATCSADTEDEMADEEKDLLGWSHDQWEQFSASVGADMKALGEPDAVASRLQALAGISEAESTVTGLAEQKSALESEIATLTAERQKLLDTPVNPLDRAGIPVTGDETSVAKRLTTSEDDEPSLTKRFSA